MVKVIEGQTGNYKALGSYIANTRNKIYIGNTLEEFTTAQRNYQIAAGYTFSNNTGKYVENKGLAALQ